MREKDASYLKDCDDGLDGMRQALAYDASLAEEVVKDDVTWQGAIFSSHQLEVRLADGSLARRDTVHHHGGAGACAIRRPGELGLAADAGSAQMCLVRQWRVALGRMTLEIPAGKLDEGEEPSTCAARELAEETGLKAEKLEFVALSYGSPGFSDEATRIFWATGLTQGKARPDEGELLNVGWYDVEDVVAGVAAGLVVDAKTIIAAYAAQARLEHEAALPRP